MDCYTKLIALSNVCMSVSSLCFSSQLLGHHHIDIVFCWNTFHVTFSHAIFFITAQTTWIKISDAFVKADWYRSNFIVCLEVGIIIKVEFLLHFGVKHVWKIKKLWPWTEILIWMHILWSVKHCVLIILNIEIWLSLLRCWSTS